jgi:hypothetical protein
VKIGPAQLDAFSADVRARQEQRITDLLRSEFPEAQQIPEKELDQIVHEEIGRAERYGLVTERQAFSFVTAAWMLGRGFDTRFPAPRHMLSDPDLNGEEKATWLRAWVRTVFETLGRKG